MSKNTRTISFVASKEIINQLEVLKKEYFFNTSKSEMIRYVLLAGIKELQKGIQKNLVSTNINNSSKSVNANLNPNLIKEKMNIEGLDENMLSALLQIDINRCNDIINGKVKPTDKELDALKQILRIDKEWVRWIN